MNLHLFRPAVWDPFDVRTRPPRDIIVSTTDHDDRVRIGSALASDIERAHVVAVKEFVASIAPLETPVHYPAREGAFAPGRDVVEAVIAMDADLAE